MVVEVDLDDAIELSDTMEDYGLTEEEAKLHISKKWDANWTKKETRYYLMFKVHSAGLGNWCLLALDDIMKNPYSMKVIEDLIKKKLIIKKGDAHSMTKRGEKWVIRNGPKIASFLEKMSKGFKDLAEEIKSKRIKQQD